MKEQNLSELVKELGNGYIRIIGLRDNKNVVWFAEISTDIRNAAKIISSNLKIDSLEKSPENAVKKLLEKLKKQR